MHILILFTFSSVECSQLEIYWQFWNVPNPEYLRDDGSNVRKYGNFQAAIHNDGVSFVYVFRADIHAFIKMPGMTLSFIKLVS